MARTLRQGNRGDDVAYLQASLNQLTVVPGRASRLPPLTVDGSFGTKTRARVVEFQAANGLTADAIVGPLTFGKLMELLARANLVPRSVAGGVGPGPGKIGGKPMGKLAGKLPGGGAGGGPGKY